MQAARTLAKGGADVTVYETQSQELFGYDWTDDVGPSIFKELEIPLPESSYFRGDGPSFVAPFSDKPMRIGPDGPVSDWSVERRVLSAVLVKLAQNSDAKFVFDTPVDSLYLENDRVCGIQVGGEIIRADLVIDSSGVLSKFRSSLPDSYKITKMPGFEEVFFAYRALFDIRDGIEPPKEHPRKMYLKHIGEAGLSWCIYESRGYCNILIGRLGGLSETTIDNAMRELRKDNPIIGDTILHGGIVCAIPIRYPSSRMVGHGYALVGDSAFMTAPMIGSGIGNALKAGEMLAQTILADNSVSIETLWKYQVRYYKERAKGDMSVDILKRTLLKADSKALKYVFDKGVINEDILNGAVSTATKLSLGAMICMAVKGIRKTGFLLSLARAVKKGGSAEKTAGKIPQEWDEATVTKWQNELNAHFQ